MVWFVKGTTRLVRGLVMDGVKSEQEKGAHDWQQGMPEALCYVNGLCKKGGLVIDPMCGSGTTLLAAKQLGRRYVGFEVDEKVANRARGRLS